MIHYYTQLMDEYTNHMIYTHNGICTVTHRVALQYNDVCNDRYSGKCSVRCEYLYSMMMMVFWCILHYDDALIMTQTLMMHTWSIHLDDLLYGVDILNDDDMKWWCMHEDAILYTLIPWWCWLCITDACLLTLLVVMMIKTWADWPAVWMKSRC